MTCSLHKGKGLFSSEREKSMSQQQKLSTRYSHEVITSTLSPKMSYIFIGNKNILHMSVCCVCGFWKEKVTVIFMDENNK